MNIRSIVKPERTRVNLLALFTFGTALLLAAGCTKKAEAPAAEASKEPDSRVSRGTNGEIILTVTRESQTLTGIKAEPLKGSERKATIKAFGRVLDSSTLGPLVADIATASVSAEASAAELKRLETLAGQNNAAARTVEAGKAAAARDKALLEAARLKLVSAWGAVIATNTNLQSVVNELATQQALLIQLNLELGEQLITDPDTVRLTSASGGTNEMEARILGPAPSVDAQTQGRTLLLFAEKNTLRLSPGASVVGSFQQTGEPHKGVVVPETAVVHHNGAVWCYLQSAPDKFERRRVAEEQPVTDGFFVKQGFRAGENVVTTGAQVLLSEELKSTEATAE